MKLWVKVSTIYERYVDITSIADEGIIESYILGYDLPDNLYEDLDGRLNELARIDNTWDNLSIIDNRGNILDSTAKEQVGKSVNLWEEEFKAWDSAMKGDVYISDVVQSMSTKKPTIIFAAPINASDENMEIHGIVMGLSTNAIFVKDYLPDKKYFYKN